MRRFPRRPQLDQHGCHSKGERNGRAWKHHSIYVRRQKSSWQTPQEIESVPVSDPRITVLMPDPAS